MNFGWSKVFLSGVSYLLVYIFISFFGWQVGTGMCMEGIEQNPIVYDLMSEMAFHREPIDVEVMLSSVCKLLISFQTFFWYLSTFRCWSRQGVEHLKLSFMFCIMIFWFHISPKISTYVYYLHLVHEHYFCAQFFYASTSTNLCGSV